MAKLVVAMVLAVVVIRCGPKRRDTAPTAPTANILEPSDHQDGDAIPQDEQAGSDSTGIGNVSSGVDENQNHAPVAVDGVIEGFEDTILTSETLSASDEDGDLLQFSIIAQGRLGVVEIDDPSSGAFTYTPLEDAAGTDSFIYVASDGTLNSNFGIITVNINASNDAPIAETSKHITGKNKILTGSLSAVDVEKDELIFTIVANANPNLGSVTIVDPSKGLFSYVPLPDTVGADNFSFKVTDGFGESTVAEVLILVNPNPGELDTSFSDDGLFTTSVAGNDMAQDVAIQVDGKVVVAGVTCRGRCSFGLTRYTRDGELDASFSGDENVFDTDSRASAVAIQNDGKILVVGTVSDGIGGGGNRYS